MSAGKNLNKVSVQHCALGKSQYCLLMVPLTAVINSTKNCNSCIWRCDYNTCLNCFYLTGWGTNNVIDSAQCWMFPSGTINPVPPQLCHYLGKNLAPLWMPQSRLRLQCRCKYPACGRLEAGSHSAFIRATVWEGRGTGKELGCPGVACSVSCMLSGLLQLCSVHIVVSRAIKLWD